jgi:hypothetical protein
MCKVGATPTNSGTLRWAEGLDQVIAAIGPHTITTGINAEIQ